MMDIYTRFGLVVFSVISIVYVIKVIFHVWSFRNEPHITEDDKIIGNVTIFLLSVLIAMCGMLLYVAIMS